MFFHVPCPMPSFSRLDIIPGRIRFSLLLITNFELNCFTGVQKIKNAGEGGETALKSEYYH